jgi:hypothetical protein
MNQKNARRVPMGTFEKKEFVPTIGRDRSDPNWDWRNPFDNPSGQRPAEEKPHSYKGKYKKENYPILDSEFETPLFCPDLVSHLRDDYGVDEDTGKKIWDIMTEREQVMAQIDFVTDPRNPSLAGDKYHKYIKARTDYLISQIKRD